MRYLAILFLMLGCVTEPEVSLKVGTLEPDGIAPVFFADVRPSEVIHWTIRMEGSEFSGSRKDVVVMEIPDPSTDTWWIAEVSWARDSLLWRGR